MICADGSRHPILKSVKRVQIRGREKLLECFLDLTERKRMEDELRIKDKAIESSINAIAITDLQGNLTYVNPAFLTIWGYSDEKEVLGRAIDEFGETKERATEIKAAVQNCGGWIGELRAKKKDGLIFDAQMSTSMVVDDAGRPLCMLATFVDITERKQAELNLARSNQELQQFAYIASHDLQEPLRMISSYLQLIELQYKGKLDAEADEFIGYAVDGAKRLQDMINALLAYSRIETRNRPIEPVESEPLLSQALINLQVGIDESGAQVTHDPLPIITADGTQMVQVFQNLISNAIKFHGHDQPKVHISATQQRAEWVFSVRDNGIGIEPQYMEQIFTIFKRLHGREYPGTGIGLALCKRIVERHRGRIWVESDPGKGTTFYFTIPD